jgi:hypothetical protein
MYKTKNRAEPMTLFDFQIELTEGPDGKVFSGSKPIASTDGCLRSKLVLTARGEEIYGLERDPNAPRTCKILSVEWETTNALNKDEVLAKQSKIFQLDENLQFNFLQSIRMDGSVTFDIKQEDRNYNKKINEFWNNNSDFRKWFFEQTKNSVPLRL